MQWIRWTMTMMKTKLMRRMLKMKKIN